MFTGIVEETGRVIACREKRGGFVLSLEASKVLEDLKIGDSLSVNGVCLTVTSLKGIRQVDADVMPETLRNTNLTDLRPGDPVNLERALTPSTRMGGHFVTGHVDGTGVLLQKREEGNAVVMSFSISPGVGYYLVKKGSVAVDGISLTVAEEGEGYFEVSLVPHTLAQTTLGKMNSGDRVNLEGDLLGKYVAKYMGQLKEESPEETGKENPRGGISMQWLQEKGFY